MISVVIPVKDGGTDLVRCLEAIARQRVEADVEVVVVDSESRDGSPARAERLGARVHGIPAEEFHHGRTRNLGAQLARGDVLVFTSQDAYAPSDTWLTKLTSPLYSDESLAGVYGRQLPHEDAAPPERYFLDFLYGPTPRRQHVSGADDLSFEVTLFSNVNAAMPRSVWSKYPFAEDIVMSEDQEWSRRVLLAGLDVLYEPQAAVHHSHVYSLFGAFRRFFDSGASAENAYVAGATSKAALWSAAARYARGEAVWLWTTGQRRWLPYATAYEVAKFTGLQLGRRHRFLPAGLNARISQYPQHWSEERSART